MKALRGWATCPRPHSQSIRAEIFNSSVSALNHCTPWPSEDRRMGCMDTPLLVLTQLFWKAGQPQALGCLCEDWDKMPLPPRRHNPLPQCMAELKLDFRSWLAPLDTDPHVQQTTLTTVYSSSAGGHVHKAARLYLTTSTMGH